MRRSRPGLTDSEARRYPRQRLRAVQLAGHDVGALIVQISAAPRKQSVDLIYEAIERVARGGSNGSEPTGESGPH